MWELNSAREYMMKTYKEPRAGWNTFSDFYITVISAILSYTANNMFVKMTFSFFYARIKDKSNELVRI